MRAVLQRVREAEVRVGPVSVARMGPGLLILLGIEAGDGGDDIEWLAAKILRLRVFDDEAGVMNRSVLDTGGGLLLVSQFTLFASTRKGTRPSWDRAARPEIARPLFEVFQQRLEALAGRPVPTGVFGAEMEIRLLNDGPVTLVVDSRLRE